MRREARPAPARRHEARGRVEQDAVLVGTADAHWDGDREVVRADPTEEDVGKARGALEVLVKHYDWVNKYSAPMPDEQNNNTRPCTASEVKRLTLKPAMAGCQCGGDSIRDLRYAPL